MSTEIFYSLCQDCLAFTVSKSYDLGNERICQCGGECCACPSCMHVVYLKANNQDISKFLN